MDLEPAVQISVIGASVWSVFSYVALRPLNESISRLGLAVKKLEYRLGVIDDRLRDLEIRVAELTQNVRDAHNRINTLEHKE